MTREECVMAKCVGGVLRATGKCVLMALALGMALRAGAEEPRYFAIRHARIVPVSGPEIKNGTVVIAKGLDRGRGREREHSAGSLGDRRQGLDRLPWFHQRAERPGIGPACPGGTRRRRRQRSTAAGAASLTRSGGSSGEHALDKRRGRTQGGRQADWKPGAMAASLPPWPRR